MSSASILRSMITCAVSWDAAAEPNRKSLSGAGGAVSLMSRWSVQSPPLTTSLGTPGSGMSEPKAPPPPANSNEVT